MPPIVPNRFLVRVCHPCPFVKDVPRDTDEDERIFVILWQAGNVFLVIVHT